VIYTMIKELKEFNTVGKDTYRLTVKGLDRGG